MTFSLLPFGAGRSGSQSRFRRGRSGRNDDAFRTRSSDAGQTAWLGDRVADDDVVAVLLGRNSELLYVAQLGVLRAGGAYVCLDPSLPDARIQQILNDAAPVAVLTDASGAARLNQAIGRSCFSSAAIPSSGIAPLTGVLLHQELSASGDAARHFPGSTCERLGPEPASRQAQLPGSLAYIIYTSGTSGVPKGVMIEHRSIVNLIQSDLDEFQLTPDDRVAQISSPAYDSSVEETWLAFSAGATLVVVDEETVRLGPDLVPWLRQERITVFSPTPTLLRSMDCGNPAEELPELSLVYVGGEALPQDIAARWAPGRRLVNGYGPTECAVTAVRGRIEPASEGEVRIHIGKPVPGLSAWILDDELHEVPPGEPGELCLGGVALGRGYRNDPEQTARRFVNHPFLGRIYRTGDRAWREPDGNFGCGGRLDAQVKLRGHRFELEEVETCLAECPGVRAAGCRLHDDGAGRQTLAAFVVPADPASPPDLATLRSLVSARLPAPMVPSRFALLAHLPTTIGGKLDRKQLPDTPTPTEPPRSASAPQHPSHARQQVDPTPAAPPASASGAPHPVLEPTHDIHQPVAEGTRERTLIIVAAIQDCLLLPTAPDPEEDFFHDLGGDSLRAALLISALRRDPSTSHLTVRDVYKARTAAALAGCRPEVVRRAPPNGAHTHQTSAAPGSGSVERGAERSASRSRTAASGPAQAIAEPSHATTLPEHGGSRASLPEVRAAPRAMRSPLPASLVQGLWLMGSLLLGGWGAGVVASLGVPQAHAVVGLLPLMAVAMVLGPLAGLAWAVLTAAPAIAIKWLLIGRYRPLRAPAWGNFYVRNWIVQQAVSQIPWRLLAGTAVQVWVLRALGARIGRRVHVERGVDLTRGGWDLLEIGDDVTLSRDAAVGLVELHRGDIVVAPVVLGNGATLDVRAGVAGDTCVEGGGYLSPLSHLPAGGRIPAGQRWDGVPAAPAGPAPLRPVPDPTSRGLPDTVWGGLFLGAHTLTRFLLSLPQSAVAFGLAAAAGWDGVRLVELLRADGPAFWVGVAGVVGALPLSLGFEALLMRGLGPVSPGVVPRWSLEYVRARLKMGLLEDAGEWLSGSLFWPVWLRAAGMRVGRDCEISSIHDVVPELVEIGDESFFADGIYLAGPRVFQGTVTLAHTRLGSNTFLGNHVVIPAGQTLPSGILLGVCTVADERSLRSDSSWFGHPPFELSRGNEPRLDRSLTHSPSPVRYWTRVVWELARFLLPAGHALLLPPLLAAAAWSASFPHHLLWLAPLALAGGSLSLCLAVLLLKWVLLGRVRPGIHPLWSCWCSRWDFLYVAWAYLAHPILVRLEGTLFLTAYVRAMGARIGRGVVLGAGFAQVVDPDMLQIEDGATVDCMFQAHTFEDRVLKIDHVRIGPDSTVGHAAVLLYGADIGARAEVAPHSVVMKGEHLLPDTHYAGCPVVQVGVW